MVMVDRANGEVFAQTTAPDGSKGYYSCLIVNRKSPLQNLDDMFAQASRLRFSNGDPNSTSGFLVPGYYVFAKTARIPRRSSPAPCLPITRPMRSPWPITPWMWRPATMKDWPVWPSPLPKRPRNCA